MTRIYVELVRNVRVISDKTVIRMEDSQSG